MKKITRWLSIGVVALLLAIVAFSSAVSFNIDIGDAGIHAGFESSRASVINVALDKTLAFAKLNKDSSQIHDGLIYLRYDLFLLSNAPGYEYHHVYAVDVTSPEYLAGYIKGGKTYEQWYNSLPKVWVDNPFLCVFVSVPSTMGYANILELGTIILNNSYSAWITNYNARSSAKVIQPLLVASKANAATIDTVKSPAEKNSKLTSFINDSRISIINPSGSTLSVRLGGDSHVLAGDPIDIGSAATNRGSSQGNDKTVIDLANPANDTGTIDTVEIWMLSSAGSTLYAATFSGSGTSYTPRDNQSIGVVATGSKQTITGLSIDVTTGDFFGGYFPEDEFIEGDTSGGSGTYYKEGNQLAAGEQTYTVLSGDAISLYGTGDTGGVAAPTNVAATDGTHTDKVVVTWTKSDGANAYKVLRGAVNASGTLGDVATFDDTSADAPTITAGSTVASDGTSTAQVELSLSGTSANNGTTHSYTVYASDDGGSTWSDASSADNGYRGVGSLTYQWQRSAAASDADYSNIDGATASTYNDTAAPAPTITAGTAGASDGTDTDKVVLSIAGDSANNGATRYYKCILNATGAAQQTSAANAGYRGVGALTYQWKVSAGDSDAAYSDIGGGTTDPYNYTSAPAPTITPGTASASDGTSNAHVVLSIAGAAVNDGAGRYYYCVLSATGAAGADTNHNRGYTGGGALTYKWYVSDGDSDASYSEIAGGTTEPYNYTSAPAGTVTPGTAAASDGTSSAYVTLTLTGQSTSIGAGRYYYCEVGASGAVAQDTNHNRGYRGVGALSYQWQVSAADSDAAYGNIAGGTTNPYNYTSAPDGTITVTTQLFRGFGADWIILEGNTAVGVDAAGRYYLCVVSADGATPQNSTSNRGYKGDASISEYGFDYGLTSGYGSDSTTTGTLTAGDSFVKTIRGLTRGTVYHFRAKALVGASWYYGADFYVCTAGSPVVYEYLNTGGDGDSDAIYGANYTAQQFTAQATSHTALYILIPLKKTGSPGDVLVELKHATAGDEPTGLAIASAILDGDLFSTDYIYWRFELDEVSLIGGDKYAIVVSAQLGGAGDYIEWQMDTGGSLAGAVGLHSVDGGSTWISDTPTDYLFEIWGNSCISVERALAYTNYIEGGDILFLLEYINVYPPYSSDGSDSKLKFVIRLLDTDGLTVLASTTQMLWGNRPGSIYLNATESTAITPGGAYYLELYGIFTGNPSTSYQLVSLDWSGTIGSWVINTAKNMEVYYSADFTTYSPKVKGEVLNDGESAASFLAGVPYLMETHPELFLSQVIQPTFTAPATQVSPLAGSWQDQVGAGIAGIFTSMGTMAGIDGKYVGSILLFFAFLGIVVSVGAKGGSPLIAAAIAFPIIGFGVWSFLVDFVIIGVVILVLAVLALIGYWVTRT